MIVDILIHGVIIYADIQRVKGELRKASITLLLDSFYSGGPA